MQPRRIWSRLASAAAAFVVFAGAAAAAPIVVDFGAGAYEFPTFGGAIYEEDGVRFSAGDPLGLGVLPPLTAGVGHFDIFDRATYPNFGPERLGAVHTGNGGDIVLVDFSGATFELESIDIERFDAPSSGVWEIVASNGSSLAFTGTGTVTFDSSWAGITGFTIRSTSVPDLNDNSGELYFDNITLLPEPRVALLALSSICGLRLARGRSRAMLGDVPTAARISRRVCSTPEIARARSAITRP